MSRYTHLKWLPFVCLAVICGLFFYYHLYSYLDLHTLGHYENAVRYWTHTHPLIAVSLYLGLFIGLIAAGIPCATLLTLLGGFLFGSWAILYASSSTTFGGFLLYAAVRLSIGPTLNPKNTGWIRKLECGFKENAFNYILMLRLVPVFPCWISNISAGALGVPALTFVSATFIGILPATYIYVMAGKSISTLTSIQNTPLSHLVFKPSVLLPLIGLAILSLFPVIYKKIKNVLP